MPKLDLCISKPARLLNRIAQRYSRLSRILMEYVDNSLDDAESFYNKEGGYYKKQVKIHIGITKNPSCIVITDNCNGMDKKQLTRLIQNVGESQKHSKFTNGQFGFGVHAFRAACKTITILSRSNNEDTYELHIDRDSMNFHPPKKSACRIKTVSGTQIVLREFDESWLEGLNGAETTNEIQYHFDGLLRRKNLTITVIEKGKKPKICKPLRYRSIDGKKLRKRININGETIKVALWVSHNPMKNQSCYFTSNGRRINEIHEVKSFMKFSRARYSVWSHPHVTGYIEVRDFLEPVITRDEFQRTTNRSILYKAIVNNIEPQLIKLVEEINAERRTVEMGRLGNILSKCFNVAVRKDNYRVEGQASYVEQIQKDPTSRVGKRKLPDEWLNDADENQENEGENAENAPNILGEKDENVLGEKDKNKAKRQKREKKIDKLKKVAGRFSMKFVHELKDPEGQIQRASLVGDDMYINVKHPDFEERMAMNKAQSKMYITQRLNSYISTVSANAYKKAVVQRSTQGLLEFKDEPMQLFSELHDLEFSLERNLRKYLPAIQKEVGK